MTSDSNVIWTGVRDEVGSLQFQQQLSSCKAVKDLCKKSVCALKKKKNKITTKLTALDMEKILKMKALEISQQVSTE